MIARREFLTGLGASLALTACTRAPKEEIVPWVQRPPELTPGKPNYYATAMTLDGYATGIVVESHEGRPTKVEGNPEHPASLGATGVFEQALIAGLYDPKRARSEEAAWTRVRDVVAKAKSLHFALAPTSSPSVAQLLDAVRKRIPSMTVSFSAAGMPRNAWAGAKLAFGRVLEARYDLTGADVVVALGADFLGTGPQKLRLARQLGDRRHAVRLYSLAPLVDVTSLTADHHLAMRASDVRVAAAALAAHFGVADPAGKADSRIAAIARDLERARGRSLVIAGDAQPPEVHALAHAINAALGNIGPTVSFAPSVILGAGDAPAPAPAEVDVLVVAGSTPPAVRARQVVRLATRQGAAADALVLAAAHALESWGDARAFDGTTTILQPLIAPLTGGKTVLDVLAAAAGIDADAHAIVRRRFTDDRAWRLALKHGVIATPIPTEGVTIAARPVVRPAAPGIELVTELDPRMHDGSFDGNPWLSELPQTVTTLTWMNAATLAPATAARLGLADGDEVTIAGAGVRTRATAPVLVVPGQAEDVVGLTLGWGRTLERGFETGIPIAKTGERVALPLTQLHHRLEGRAEQIVRGRPKRRSLSLYSASGSSAGPKWGMAIDLSKCIGCDACMIACQAENNVPVVGAEEVLHGRVMHWLRVDSYFTEDGVITQPMLCQHCEKAPCEYVCPTGATTHSPDGINEMTYNRCVGTRFCSNNCPYKARRFNWFDFHRHETKTETLAHNPDVTVRERGVMEKCTFCVQRIRGGTPVTACQQACPTRAIAFGDLADPSSRVARLHADAFAVLDDLGTEPRVRYLAKKPNRNPELG